MNNRARELAALAALTVVYFAGVTAAARARPFWYDFFVRRRKGPIFDFTALLLPLVTDAYSFAIDARAYGPVLGFCGLALLAWQAAAEGRRRIAALPILTAGIAGRLLCQYYAALIYLPLAGAEGASVEVRSLAFRREMLRIRLT